jgi:hypothetical protein
MIRCEFRSYERLRMISIGRVRLHEAFDTNATARLDDVVDANTARHLLRKIILTEMYRPESSMEIYLDDTQHDTWMCFKLKT